MNTNTSSHVEYDLSNLSTTTLGKSWPISLAYILSESGVCSTLVEARALIKARKVNLGTQLITDPDYQCTTADDIAYVNCAVGEKTLYCVK